jgi:hypothetical protein
MEMVLGWGIERLKAPTSLYSLFCSDIWVWIGVRIPYGTHEIINQVKLVTIFPTSGEASLRRIVGARYQIG